MKETLLKELIDLVNIKLYINFYTNFDNRTESLSHNEYMILNIIDRLEKPTVNSLVEILDISQPNISSKIASLQAKGYVEKHQSKKDGRRFLLKTTPKFRDYKDKSYLYIDRLYSDIAKKLDKKQLDSFNMSLKDMIGEIEKA